MRHFIAVIIALVLVILVMLFSGCTTTRELTTNTIDTTLVIRTRSTETVPIVPVMQQKRPPLVSHDGVVVVPNVNDPGFSVESPGANDPDFFQPTKPVPRIWEGETKRHRVKVDLAAGTVSVNDNAEDSDTSKHLSVGKKTEIIPEPVNESHWYDGVLYIIGAIVGLIVVGGLFYRFVIVGK